MSHLSDCKALIGEIVTLLEQETACLKQGMFQQLNHISMRKLELINELDALVKEDSVNSLHTALSSELRQLAKVSEDNGLLLQGVFNGTKAAQASLARLQQQEAAVGTYGRRGERHLLSETGIFNQKTV